MGIGRNVSPSSLVLNGFVHFANGLAFHTKYLTALSPLYVPALSACTKLRTIRTTMEIPDECTNDRKWSLLAHAVFQQLTRSTRTSAVECVDVIVSLAFPPCGNVLDDISGDGIKQNITQGADVMWRAAGQAIEAGKTRTVNITLFGWWPEHRKYFIDRMRQVVPALMADGRLAVV